MNLNLRLNLSIIAPCVLVLVLGTMIVIGNARQAVAEETEASANLLLQFLTAVTVSGDVADRRELYAALVSNLSRLDDARHLSIALISDGEPVIVPAMAAEWASDDGVPRWFTRMVAPPPVEYRRRLSGPGLPYAEIAIRADARDEITEAWRETRIALGLLVLFAALAMGLIYVMVSRPLRPIDRILSALHVVERGEYGVRLPQFALPEMQRIARGFNRMAEVLDAQRRENQALNKRSLAIQENERRHLARELHDELGQSISAIKALAFSITQHADSAAPTIRDSAGSIVLVCDRVHQVVRNMMSRLRPAVVDELGLQLGLERMVDDWNTHHADVFCRLATSGAVDSLGDELQIAVYRIAQEALNNVARHAGPGTVDLRLEISADVGARYLRLQVRDDGRGFEPGPAGPGVGLPGMRERVESLGGEMKVTARTGAGVGIDISIPVDNPPQRPVAAP
jgi:two-component system sensor histidine kinase UhpB